MLFLFTLIIPSVYSTDCYWRKWPWCGTFMKCGSDHLLKTGITPSCFLTPSKYCCPSGPYEDVILCEHADFRGDCVVHSIKKHSCVTLRELFEPSSIKTLGNCFRLYEDNNCGGQSIAIYSQKHQNLINLNFDNRAQSVSNCFPANYIVDQCPNSSMTDKNCRWFIANVTVGPTWKSIDRNGVENPVRYYEMGRNGRTEMVQAMIDLKHLVEECPKNADDFHNEILPRCLGGPTKDSRNLFERGSLIDRELWVKTVSQMYNDVLAYKGIVLSINVLYPNENTKRPTRLIYRTMRMDTGDTTQVISLPNP